ncbi:Spo0E family sporulation regulatory protein-aspartic acid phosphatase [Bacillus sp. V3B]|uniref:Spo0E family sporulation regulatory protein-aspartic acid phosphatase n=1 Tax=Bacillus sp. V3B TaxID=2804915 RepID=UPI00210B3920|nr:Spo0E family sporulation regulatory protein-aspartic acid phosphatase [Bacillus sp. V3B]
MEAADLFKVNNDSIRNLHSTWVTFFVSFFTWFNITPLSMDLIEIDELEDRIHQLKKELIQVALTTGLNSHDTLCCSQKLDELITIYQKLTIDNSQKFDQKSCIEI